MDANHFNKLLLQKEKEFMQTLERQPEPEETFKFTPVQAGYIEEKLN